MAVATGPAAIVVMGFDAFAAVVRAELPRWGGIRVNRHILALAGRAVYVPVPFRRCEEITHVGT
ncbi:hypothetical protein [Nocardia sp. R6R-6]|uniref:hypothetical protein n=1 Tax=Nocardia sp. R6R-6 TaxID=3459303 RepID=UPI00403E246A